MNIKKALGGMGILKGAVIAILLAGWAIKGEAQTTNISAQNTSLQITLGGSSAGLSDWTINGVNQLDYQWFYYSIGSSTLSTIDSIAPWTAPTITGGTTPSLTETYADGNLSVKTKYILQSQILGSSQAKLATTITLQNLSATNETLHFYQFSDLDLAGMLGGQNVQFAGSTSPGAAPPVYQWLGGQLFTGTFTAAGASVAEAAGIEDGNQLGLGTGLTAPIYNDSPLPSAGPGEVDYAYEVDVTLSANQSVIISEIQSVPEPSTMALALSGTMAFGLVYWRKLVFFKKAVKKASL